MTTTASTTAVSPRDDNDGVDDGGRVTQVNGEELAAGVDAPPPLLQVCISHNIILTTDY